MIGMETAFSLVYSTLKKEKISTNTIINLFSFNPSKIIGITPNTITEKNEAEINIIDCNKKWVFSENHIKSMSKNTPLLGRKMKSKVEFTINKGFISKHLD